MEEITLLTPGNTGGAVLCPHSCCHSWSNTIPFVLLANVPLGQARVPTCVTLNVANAGTKTARNKKENCLCALVDH